MTSAKSDACISASTPPPYSSVWISTSAALARPPMRGRPQLWGSASFSWYAERCTENSRSRSRELRLDAPVDGEGADLGQQRLLEGVLEGGPGGEQRRLPLPALVDAGQAAVV